MKQINSETTTWLGEVASKIGTPRGERGLVTRENSRQVGQWLSQQDVAQMDQAAVSRASSHNVALEVKTDMRFPVGENGERLGFYEVAVGCSVHGSAEDRRAALADLRNFQTPAEIRQIEEWLAELSVITASRRKDGMEAGLMVTAYASRLREYPADVVRDALLGKSWKWWPTWDELRKYCEAKASPRRHMIAALQKPMPEPAPKRRKPTPEEKDRMQAMIDEMFPNRSPEMRKAAVDEAMKGNCMAEADEK